MKNQKLPPRWTKEIVSLIEKSKGLILEIGAGDGLGRQVIEKKGNKWVGADIKYCSQLTVIADAHHLPFKNATFDGVVTIATFEHLYNPWLALAEINRVLKPNGLLTGSVAFLEPYHGSYFHFTHLGLKTILAENNFQIIYLSPGWFVFESVFRRFFILPICSKIIRFLELILLKIRRIIIFTLLLFKITKNRQQMKKFIEDDIYRFAGSLIFQARKLN